MRGYLVFVCSSRLASQGDSDSWPAIVTLLKTWIKWFYGHFVTNKQNIYILSPYKLILCIAKAASNSHIKRCTVCFWSPLSPDVPLCSAAKFVGVGQVELLLLLPRNFLKLCPSYKTLQNKPPTGPFLHLASFLAPPLLQAQRITAANALTSQPVFLQTVERVRPMPPDRASLHPAQKKSLFFQWRSMTTHKRAHFSCSWVSHFPFPLGVGHSGECAAWSSLNQDEISFSINWELAQHQVLKPAIIGEKAIHLIDMNAWYVLSVSSRHAVRGLVPRLKLFSLWPVNTAEGQCSSGGNGNTFVLLLDTLPGGRQTRRKNSRYDV